MNSTGKTDQPNIANAPGLRWLERKKGWEGRWQARTDLIKAGFAPKSMTVFGPSWDAPTPAEVAAIQLACVGYQQAMSAWSKARTAPKPDTAGLKFDGSIRSLIICYETDPNSPFQTLRYDTHRCQVNLNIRINRLYGEFEIKDIFGPQIKRWYGEWLIGADSKRKSNGPKKKMAHAFVTHMRALATYGKTCFDPNTPANGLAECARLKEILSDLRFTIPRARKETITADQVIAIRKVAHAEGLPEIAFGTAMQFELLLRQKDVIGEWVPINFAGISDVYFQERKWLAGIRVDQIDHNMTLRHTTSKKQKDIEVNLRNASMVMEEWPTMFPNGLPASGPLMIRKLTGRPWVQSEYVKAWRKCATIAGVPRSVWNMDYRSGGISEARSLGADMEDIRVAATHSDIDQTRDYDRLEREARDRVMTKRAAGRAAPTNVVSFVNLAQKA